ncbi:NADPH-dependent ferric siderophore reductase [Pelomonas sp. HMWF004]|nr:NADPH-dependent ferric siderophore reductase [Pelomonas sp. HMWF004]
MQETIPLPLPFVERVRHELVRRELTVLRVDSPSPQVRRIVLGGEQLQGFVSLGFDDHVKLIFDTADGGWLGRDYTPRAYDAKTGELVIEFSLHGDGPASRWAAQAAPQQRLRLGGPKGSFIVDAQLDWHVLIGDDSAIPAIARRLEELPASSQAIVRLLVPAAEQPALRTAAALDLQCFEDATSLLEAARGLTLPTGRGYAWCAGEAALAAALRTVLVDELGLDRHAVRAAAYWKRGAIGHHENLG